MKKKIKSTTKVISTIMKIIMIRGTYKSKNSRINNTTINMMTEIKKEIEVTVITEDVVHIKTTMMTADMVVKTSNITKKNIRKNH